MLKNTLFLSMLAACLKQGPAVEGHPGNLQGFAGQNFVPTNSVCMDGLITAMDHMCSVPIEIESGYPYVVVQCTKALPNMVEWHKYQIVAVNNEQIEPPTDATLLCADVYVRVFIQERP